MDRRIASFCGPSVPGPTIPAGQQESGQDAPDPTQILVPGGAARMHQVLEDGIRVLLQREKRQREDERAAEVRHQLSNVLIFKGKGGRCLEKTMHSKGRQT